MKKTTKRIKLKDMPDDKKYDKLKPESKQLMNCLKMICYRAETAIANYLITDAIGISNEEKRMVVKQITRNNADLSLTTKTTHSP